MNKSMVLGGDYYFVGMKGDSLYHICSGDLIPLLDTKVIIKIQDHNNHICRGLVIRRYRDYVDDPETNTRIGMVTFTVFTLVFKKNNRESRRGHGKKEYKHLNIIGEYSNL